MNEFEHRLAALNLLANPEGSFDGNVGASLTLDMRGITSPQERYTIWVGLPNGASVRRQGATFDETVALAQADLNAGRVSGG